MTREEVFQKLQEVFADVFDNDDIRLTDATTAADVPGWDSLVHITLMNAVEDEFDTELDMKDVVALKNVGELADILLATL